MKLSSFIFFEILLVGSQCLSLGKGGMEKSNKKWNTKPIMQYLLDSGQILQAHIISPDSRVEERTTTVEPPSFEYPLDSGEILQIRIISRGNKNPNIQTDAGKENIETYLPSHPKKNTGNLAFAPQQNYFKNPSKNIKFHNLKEKHKKFLNIFAQILAMEEELGKELFTDLQEGGNPNTPDYLNVNVNRHIEPWRELAKIFHELALDMELKAHTKTDVETKASVNPTENRNLNPQTKQNEDYLRKLLQMHLSLGIAALSHHLQTTTRETTGISASNSNMNHHDEHIKHLLETQLALGIASAFNHKNDRKTEYNAIMPTKSSFLKPDSPKQLHDEDVNIRIHATSPMEINIEDEHRSITPQDTDISHVVIRSSDDSNLKKNIKEFSISHSDPSKELDKYHNFVKKGTEFLLHLWNQFHPNKQSIYPEKFPEDSEKFNFFIKKGTDLLAYMWSKLQTK